MVLIAGKVNLKHDGALAGVVHAELHDISGLEAHHLLGRELDAIKVGASCRVRVLVEKIA